MDSNLGTTKNFKGSSSPCFRSLEPLLPQAQNGDSIGITPHKSVLMGNQVILLGKSKDQIKDKSTLWAFDLETLKWDTIEVENSSFLIENNMAYTACALPSRAIMLLGCTERITFGKK